MAGTQNSTSAASDDKLIASVVNDIVDYDVNSFATISNRNFDASEYHPFDRQIGGAEANTYQSSSTSASDESSLANRANDSATASYR